MYIIYIKKFIDEIFAYYVISENVVFCLFLLYLWKPVSLFAFDDTELPPINHG
jgi:hypothetical protein